MVDLVKPKIVVSCMDYRINPILEGLFSNFPEIQTIRTAGGRLNRSLLEEINSLDPREVVWMPHTDCGALKFAHSQINGQSIFPMHPITKQTAGILKSALRDHTDDTRRTNLDHFVSTLVSQGEIRLRERFQHSNFSAELVDVSGMGKHGHLENILIVSEDTKLPPSILISNATNAMRRNSADFDPERNKFYILQMPKISFADTDIDLAKKALGITTIILHTDTKKSQIKLRE